MTDLRLDRRAHCLIPRKLLLLAASPLSAETYPLYDRHLRSCDVCAENVAALRTRLLDVPIGVSVHHLSELAIAELADRAYEETGVDDNASHLAACGSCRAAFVALCDLLDDGVVSDALSRLRPEIAHRSARATQPIRRRITVGLVAAAAVLLLAVASMPHVFFADWNAGASHVLPGTEPLRHATITTAAAPRLVAPSGVVTRVDTLLWTEVPRADLYRVVVYDSTGIVVWQADVSTAFAVVPDSVSSRWTGGYSWFVKARTSVDRWVPSEFSEFVLFPSAR